MTPAMPSHHEDIRGNGQLALIGFMDAELKLGTTFAQSALLSYSAGHMDHYEQAKRSSLKAIEAINRFMPRVTDVQVREEIRDRLAELERLFFTI